MSYTIYQLIHLAGVITIFLALGSLIAAEKPGKGAGIMHGIAAFLILLGGFGMQAKGQLGFPVWLMVKIVIWLIVSGSIVLAKRKLLPPAALYGMLIVLGIVAAYLGIHK